MTTEVTPGAPGATSATIVACATEDGEILTGEHFGSAPIYTLHEWAGNGFRPIGALDNSTEEEEEGDHGAREKARSILGLLSEEGASVVLARRYGPNIRRIRTKLVPVVTGARTAAGGLEQLAAEWKRIEEVLQLPSQERYHVVLQANGQEGSGEYGRAIATVDPSECRGCGLCVDACPVEAIEMGDAIPQIDQAICVGCGSCVQACPVGALGMDDAIGRADQAVGDGCDSCDRECRYLATDTMDTLEPEME